MRVGGTRVRLDTIIHAFNEGATAEEILQQYPALALSDIYATISCYLQHRTSVDAYLQEHHEKHDEARQAAAFLKHASSGYTALRSFRSRCCGSRLDREGGRGGPIRALAETEVNASGKSETLEIPPEGTVS